MTLAIDGCAWVHVLYHGRGGVEVIPAFQSWIEAAVRHIRPSRVLVCFDRRSFRYDLLPGYKAGRKARPGELEEALAAAPGACFPHAAIAEDGFEADDCLATVAALGRSMGEKVVIASPDKDLRQCLVAGAVTILRGFRTWQGALSEPDWFSAWRLEKECGVRPSQWADYQALVGDPTDGIAGCPGWGDVTARKCLAAFGSLQAILDNPWKLPITTKQRLALEAFRPAVPLTLQLVTLRTDVPVAVALLQAA
jgi:DNA polymerase-1